MANEKPKVYDFGGWATKFNIKCSDGRTIKSQAFKHCDGMVVPLVYNHDHENLKATLGKCELQHRDEGIYAYCSFNETENGKDAKEMVRHGDISCLSIFANHLTQVGKDVVHGDIREVSLVLAGANPGALIDNVLIHSEDGSDSVDSESADIYHDDETIELDVIRHTEGQPEPENHVDDQQVAHTDENGNPVQTNEQPNPQDDLEHADKNGKKTVKTVFESAMKKLDKTEQTVIYGMLGAAEQLQHKEDNQMSHNVFEEGNNPQENKVTCLAHSDWDAIVDSVKHGTPMRDAYNAKCDEKGLSHSITNIENLFPEAKAVQTLPNIVDIDHDWVAIVMAGVHKTPWAKIKSTDVTLTADEARAKGYVTGHQKVEEVITASKRVTNPTTVYKLQKIDRDNIIDISDFDVVSLVKAEMRVKLNEELARAYMFGDGRSAASDDKVDEQCIRPVVSDNEFYTITRSVGNSGSTKAELAAIIVDDAVESQEFYKGSGNTTMFVRRDIISKMMLLKDLNQRRIYKDEKELATAMMVNRIVAVPTEVMGSCLAMYIDLKDYNVGTNKGGQVNFFDDFNLDLNKMEYLIEARCSGANTKPKSAVVFVQGSNAAPKSAAPKN